MCSPQVIKSQVSLPSCLHFLPPQLAVCNGVGTSGQWNPICLHILPLLLPSYVTTGDHVPQTPLVSVAMRFNEISDGQISF